ncbi:metallophosphoesterase family protein [uncultured Clostridium sp.]|uniref:metallophosphoesterase family protein n=1 Tax=uncultured Clostridium sp. TaxID=59620 RepID=UPI002620330A|nr:metallophosphoesterase family protein [uncultured Clostridium sp.]
MERVFITSDVHGGFNELIEGLEKIKFKEDDKLYILGDILDKGPDSFKVLNYVMSAENISLIKGNHEYMLQLAIEEDERIRDYINTEGKKKIEKIKKMGNEYFEKVYKYIKNLPYYIILNDDFLLVHGGIDIDINDSKEEVLKRLENTEVEEEILINRSLWIDTFDKELKKEDFGSKAFNIIIGHTPMQNIFKKINEIGIRENKFGKKVICLDTGVFSSYKESQGRLSFIQLDKEGIKDIIYINSKN